MIRRSFLDALGLSLALLLMAVLERAALVLMAGAPAPADDVEDQADDVEELPREQHPEWQRRGCRRWG